MKSAQEYRRKVEECKQRAYSAVHPDDKAGWVQLAECWQDLAELAEKSAEQRGLTAALSVVGSDHQKDGPALVPAQGNAQDEGTPQERPLIAEYLPHRDK